MEVATGGERPYSFSNVVIIMNSFAKLKVKVSTRGAFNMGSLNAPLFNAQSNADFSPRKVRIPSVVGTGCLPAGEIVRADRYDVRPMFADVTQRNLCRMSSHTTSLPQVAVSVSTLMWSP